MTTNTDVLIIGAGPTGLTLALWLSRLGVRMRIVDKAAGPGETSRALAVQARTLEFHRQIGIVDDVIAAGVKLEQLAIRVPHTIKATLKLSTFGEGLSRYPFAFALPQDIHERILIEHLAKAGIQVERRTELSGFEQDGEGVTATLQKDGVRETVRAGYVVGADGAHSAVRHGLKLAFPGGKYDQVFYVADVQGTGEHTTNGLDACIGTYGFALVMPVRQLGSLRIIGIVPQAHEADETITFEDIRADIERDSGIAIKTLNWFSSYRVHHRVSEKFRVGRAILAGDAAHIHSPAGGQGMNTGIGDAVNLAWKLAAVVQERALPKLLDSYEPERRAFAQLLIKSTDTAFKLITGRSWPSRIWRQYVMPRVAGAIANSSAGGRAMFRLLSQTRINYRGMALAQGQAGEVRGGDRLPYVVDGVGDNFGVLGSLDWQVHVYGDATPAFRAALAPTGVPLHVFAWNEAAKAAGLARDAVYLVRPDGHVALAAAMQDGAAVVQYLAALGVKRRAPRLALAS